MITPIQPRVLRPGEVVSSSPPWASSYSPAAWPPGSPAVRSGQGGRVDVAVAVGVVGGRHEDLVVGHGEGTAQVPLLLAELDQGDRLAHRRAATPEVVREEAGVDREAGGR